MNLIIIVTFLCALFIAHGLPLFMIRGHILLGLPSLALLPSLVHISSYQLHSILLWEACCIHSLIGPQWLAKQALLEAPCYHYSSCHHMDDSSTVAPFCGSSPPFVHEVMASVFKSLDAKY